MKLGLNKKYVVGIDEAGRGPLAGPVAVGIFLIEKSALGNLHRPGLCKMLDVKKTSDSKKLKEKEREEIFEKIKELQKRELAKWSVALISEKVIDKKGIVEAIRIGIEKCLKSVGALPQHTMVMLDGGIYAPREFKNQKTIIKGDEKEPLISLASICAKVVRDRKMKILSKKYRQYNFDIHKGYGTKNHRENIKNFGLSPIHRKSFCKKITSV